MFDQGISGEEEIFRKVTENQGSCSHFLQEKYHVSSDPITLT